MYNKFMLAVGLPWACRGLAVGLPWACRERTLSGLASFKIEQYYLHLSAGEEMHELYQGLH